MLPVERRVRRHEDFTRTVRAGRRAGAPALVVHVLTQPDPHPARAGFVVGRAVGPAVARNRIRRQLRHLISSHLASLDPGTDVVVRVTPAAATASRRELARQLSTSLERAAGSAVTT